MSPGVRHEDGSHQFGGANPNASRVNRHQDGSHQFGGANPNASRVNRHQDGSRQLGGANPNASRVNRHQDGSHQFGGANLNASRVNRHQDGSHQFGAANPNASRVNRHQDGSRQFGGVNPNALRVVRHQDGSNQCRGVKRDASRVVRNQDGSKQFRGANPSSSHRLPTEEEKRQIRKERMKLPMFFVRPRLTQEFMKHVNIVIIAETGSGKTTQIPQYILEAGLHAGSTIAITQPRKVAAISVAERVARERCSLVGEQVGYSVRFLDKTTHYTRIKFMTDGMLVREAMTDPLLMRYSYVILDEVHERSLQTDILFGIVKQAQKRREHQIMQGKRIRPLKTVTMSATMNADLFSKYWDNAPVFNIRGRRYRVECYFAAEVVMDHVFGCLVTCMQLIRETPASEGILMFLTGQDEIEGAILSLRNALKDAKLGPAVILPLYAALPDALQKEALKPAPPGKRKIIIATNIAEASVTIAGIKHVIDSGRAKVKSYDPVTGMEALVVQKISRGQCGQRAGRAGRLGPGTWHVMLTEEEFDSQPELPEAEIRRVNLSAVVLQLLKLEVQDILSFPLVEKPHPSSVMAALRELWLLGAVEVQDLRRCRFPVLSAMGRRMVIFPLDPRFSRMIVASADLGCLHDVLTLVSILSVESVFVTRLEQSVISGPGGDAHSDDAQTRRKFYDDHGDMLTYIKIFSGFKQANQDSHKYCRENGLQHRALSFAVEVKSQLLQICGFAELHSRAKIEKKEEKICMAICEGLFMNCAKLNPDGSYDLVGRSGTAYIHPSSCLFGHRPEMVVFVELVKTSKCYMRHVIRINPEWVEEKQGKLRHLQLNASSIGRGAIRD